MRFADRHDAGRQLAQALKRHHWTDAVVIALPRGGVPVAWEVARELEIPLEVWVSRKIGAPGQPELGVGAVSEDGTLYLDRGFVERSGFSETEVVQEAERQALVASERAQRLRGPRGRPIVTGRTVILVDDGIATGGTFRAAIQALRNQGAARVVVATPVAQVEVADGLSQLADDVICLQPVQSLGAISDWYEDFQPVTDEEAAELLRSEAAPGRHPLRIPLDAATLDADLSAPPNASGLVVIAHVSGKARRSRRNREAAAILNRAGLATLMLDLLTADEEVYDRATTALRYDVDLLARRLGEVTDLIAATEPFQHLPIGYFAVDTAAAAALIAGADRPGLVNAIACRSGRPDLAAGVLGEVRAPTLLIVGGDDLEVLALNQRVLPRLGGHGRLEVVQGATHPFKEPETLELAAHLAAQWFTGHLGRVAVGPATQTHAED